MTERKMTDVLGELVDEIRVQAWLAGKELRTPSAPQDPHLEEASVLARMRDEIRVQLHLGQLELNDEWTHIEERWRTLVARDVEPAAEALATGFDEVARGILKEIRDGYDALRGR